jgi:hypothetical protein
VSYWVKWLDEVPLVPTDDPNDFAWYPLQHHFGLGAFGVNAFGGDSGILLVAEHDERESGQEELYVVVRGAARFTIDGRAVDAPAVSVTEDGTILLAVGAPARSGFASTWNPANFEQVPRAD